jgi:hypothetical protein
VTLTIPTATAADEGAVLDLIEELFAAPGSAPAGYSREEGAARFRASIEGADRDVLLADDAGATVGLASVYADIPSIRFGHRC